MSKPKKLDDFPATVGPGDFPLGSVESRAAARSWLTTASKPTQYDNDCALLHTYFDGARSRLRELAIPDWIRRAPEWEHGRRLTRDDFKEYDGVSEAALLHFACSGRWPRDGEVWGYADLQHFQTNQWPADVHRACEAWERRFPGVEYPMKFEDGRQWFQCNVQRKGPDQNHANVTEWVLSESDLDIPERAWFFVLYHAGFGLECSAVRFAAVADGGWRVEPAEWFQEKSPVRQLIGVYSPQATSLR